MAKRRTTENMKKWQGVDLVTVDELVKTLNHLQEQGFGSSPVFLARDEEWNGLNPLYKGRFGAADVLGTDDAQYFMVPYNAVAIGCFM